MRHILSAAVLACLLATGAWAETPQARFGGIMDSVFGRGNWRLTGGYRTPAREDELRRQGALTVRAGGLSRHSMGRPGAPGAYDVVVRGMSPWQAADKLRAAGAPFRRYSPKGRHGSQGPHLHLEPLFIDFRGLAAPQAGGEPWIVFDVSPAQEEAARLRVAALNGDAMAQLHLGELYAEGLGVGRDLAAARYWMLLARHSAGQDLEMRAEAAAALADLEPRMSREELEHAERHASAGTLAAPRPATARLRAADLRVGAPTAAASNGAMD